MPFLHPSTLCVWRTVKRVVKGFSTDRLQVARWGHWAFEIPEVVVLNKWLSQHKQESCIILVIQWPLCSAFTAHGEMTWVVKLETLHPFMVTYPHPKSAWVFSADAVCFCSSRSEFVFSVLRMKILRLWWQQIAGIRKICRFNPDPASMWSNTRARGETPCISGDAEQASSWEVYWNQMPCSSSAMVTVVCSKDL